MANKEFISVMSFLTGGMHVLNPKQEFSYLTPNISNKELGSLVRKSLKDSWQIMAEEFIDIFNNKTAENVLKKQEEFLKNKYGYKNKRALYKEMRFVSLFVKDNQIIISPNKKKG